MRARLNGFQVSVMATELRRTSIARLSTDGDNKGELTNEVYGYEVVDLHAWEQAEGETNAFAAPGRSGAMVIPQDVLALRAARVKTKSRRDK